MKKSNWCNKRLTKLNCGDMILVKLSTVGVALLIAKLWPPILSADWYWYLLLAVIAGYIPAYKFFCKK